MAQTDPKPQLISPLAHFAPALVIFDKDGTLIDFHFMWGNWLAGLAQRLEAETGLPLAPQLFTAMGFDPVTYRIIPNGALALAPVAEIHRLLIQELQAAGLSVQASRAAVEAAWQKPDPIRLARPLTDLPTLFKAVRAAGAKIAIATSDDRSLTEATLAELQLTNLVDTLVCADDSIPIKPAPDMVLTVCARLHLPVSKTVMIGDNVPDLQMGRAAGAGLTIGVLSGLASADELALYADLIVPSVDDLLVREDNNQLRKGTN